MKNEIISWPCLGGNYHCSPSQQAQLLCVWVCVCTYYHQSAINLISLSFTYRQWRARAAHIRVVLHYFWSDVLQQEPIERQRVDWDIKKKLACRAISFYGHSPWNNFQSEAAGERRARQKRGERAKIEIVNEMIWLSFVFSYVLTFFLFSLRLSLSLHVSTRLTRDILS